MKLVYSPHYNIRFFGLERFHPFDSAKYGRAWKELGRASRKLRDKAWVRVPGPTSLAELATLHDEDYLKSLSDPKVLARALELPIARRLPGWLAWRIIVRPMLWSVAGSLIAAREAQATGLAVNLSGGYHHARPDRGEGFCLFNDIAYLVHGLRAEGKLAPHDRVVSIDLDAHQGNGVSHHFRHDSQVFLYDAFNPRIYPRHDRDAHKRVDCPVLLPDPCGGKTYLRLLKETLPGFLDSAGRSERIALAIYNAGTDVYEGDPLGGLKLNAADLLARDLLVIDQVRSRGIPLVMLLSGGYSRESFRLVANTVIALLHSHS